MTAPSEIFADFEYRDDGKALVLGCFLAMPGNIRVEIDFRQPTALDELQKLQAQFSAATWFSFAASAEIGCFLQAGLGVTDMRWVDLMVEAKQITGSHTRYYSRRSGLLATLEAFEITTRGSVAMKEAMRSVILDNVVYSPDQWAKIVDYCWSDLEALPILWQAIQAVHTQAGKPYEATTAVFRCEYIKACAILDHRSRGFPVDVALLHRIYGNQKLLRRKLAEWTNEHYAAPLFRYDRRMDRYSFHFAGLTEHLDKLDFPVSWERTPKGRLRMDAEYLDEFGRKNDYFKPLATTRLLLDQLKSADMRPLEHNGFIKGTSLPFHTITGRNQPLTKSGFLLNLAPWLRFVVRPQPGHVLIVADWSQQEIVLAAALSGDRQLKAALETDDVYMALARMADAAPPDATKASHPAARSVFKTVQLGVSYGMGVILLGTRLFLQAKESGRNISHEEAIEQAGQIMQWHRATFKDYWRFVNHEVRLAKGRGWCRAKDGWTLFTDQHSRFTTLQNFPMQANGAVILREAVKLLAKHHPEVEFVCSLHDSLILYAHEDDEIAHSNILRRVMQQATDKVMASMPMPMPINIDVKVHTHQTGYVSHKGQQLFDRIIAMLDAEGV